MLKLMGYPDFSLTKEPGNGVSRQDAKIVSNKKFIFFYKIKYFFDHFDQKILKNQGKTSKITKNQGKSTKNHDFSEFIFQHDRKNIFFVKKVNFLFNKIFVSCLETPFPGSL